MTTAGAQSTGTYGNFTYFDRGSHIEIIQCYRYAYGSVTIPSSISGKPVTHLYSSAFSGCTSITSVNIPSSVTTLGSAVFSDCTQLSSVTIPSSVRQIGSNPFSGCSKLTSIGVSSSSNYFKSNGGIVYNKSLRTLYACPPGKTGSISIPSSVTTIRSRAFYTCEKISAVGIPASVTSIGDYVFSGCAALETITVDTGNPSYSSVDGLLYNKSLTRLLRCPGGKTGHVSFPSETSVITSNALSSCSYETITLPSGITEIAPNMFYGCSNLRSFTIPNTVTSIGRSAFAHCYALESIEIPATVSTLGSNLFYVCTGLKQATLPHTLTAIGDGWFYQCESLSSITIPENVTTIGENSFSQCTALTHIRIPDAVESISIRAFFRSGLLTVTVPENVATMGNIVFSYCPNLREILTSPANNSFQSVDGILYSKDLTTLIQCPAGKSGPVTVPGSVTKVLMNAFSFCENITVVRFMGDAPTMGSSAGNDYTVYYFQGSNGFSSPTWMGHDSIEDPQATEIGNWLVSHGLPYDSDLESSSNKTGTSLLLVYAFDLDPASNPAAAMPQIQLDEFSLSLRYYAGRSELNYSVEASTNLSDWSDEDITISEPDASGFRTASIVRSTGKTFIRVVVQQ